MNRPDQRDHEWAEKAVQQMLEKVRKAVLLAWLDLAREARDKAGP